MLREAEPEAMDAADEADAYAAANFSSVNAAFVSRLLYLAGSARPALCLDLGTGPGDIPVRIAQQGVPWRIVAADLSTPMLAYARKASRAAGLHWGIHPLCMDAKNMPLPAKVFDIIFSNSILHHLSDMQPFWAEIRRIAKPGAFVMLRDLARPDSTRTAREIVTQYAASESVLLQEEYFRSLLAAYTPDELRQQLAHAGLPLLRVEMVSDRHLDVFGRMPQ